MRIYGKRGGKVGGKVCLLTMTDEERSERARKAGLAAAANMTPEERSERARNAAQSKKKKSTPKQYNPSKKS